MDSPVEDGGLSENEGHPNKPFEAWSSQAKGNMITPGKVTTAAAREA